MAESKRLAFFSETIFGSKAPNNFPSSCPSLDLSTTWDAVGKNLYIYRPPAQIVSKIHQAGVSGLKAPEAVAVTWKPDGQFLAVGWSDGIVRLMGLENNKAAHHIAVCTDTSINISHIGWAICNIANQSSELPLCGKEDIGNETAASTEDNMPPNLPQDLTFLEVDTALPKVSPLPAGSAGSDDDATVFTLRTGIEFLFQPPKREECDQVNVMVVGTSDGKLQLSIYDSFLVGTFPGPVPNSQSISRMISHAAHSKLSTHALLYLETHSEPDCVYLVPMDLPFISSSPINLSLLGTKLTTLQKLLRYIKQAQLHMQVEWKNTRELPSRFLRSVQGGLEETTDGPRSIVPALYHTVVTGHAYEPVREWLVDSLAERGHKRWDKAVVSGLENLRSLVHENFLPALERCLIIVSRLRGLAQFYDDRDDIGFSTARISRVMDIVGCLALIGHKILSNVMDELEHFHAFSSWLRFKIDHLVSSSASTSMDELTEKEVTMNTSKILTYIERYLIQSPLDVFFDEIPKKKWQDDWEHIEDGLLPLPLLDAQLRGQEMGQPCRTALLHVEFLVSYLAACSSRIFNGIAEAKKRSVRFGAPVKLSIGHPIALTDMRMCHTGTNQGMIHLALASKATSTKVYIFRSGIDIMNGISASQCTTGTCIDLSTKSVVDIKFLNDKTLVILCTQDGTAMVLLIPVESPELHYTLYDENEPENITTARWKGSEEYVLPAEYAMRPVKMEVHDRTDFRGDIPERICLLASNRVTWRTFTLPERRVQDPEQAA